MIFYRSFLKGKILQRAKFCGKSFYGKILRGIFLGQDFAEIFHGQYFVGNLSRAIFCKESLFLEENFDWDLTKDKFCGESYLAKISLESF